MKKFAKLAVVVALASAGIANAALVIDNFKTDGYAIQTLTAIGSTATHSTPGLGFSPDIMGGYRDVFIQRTGGTSGLGTVSSNVDTTSGTFSFNQENDTSGIATLRWDGANTAAAVNTSGLGGQMLSDNATGFEFTVKTDAGNPMTSPYFVKISVWDMAANLSTFLFPATNTAGSYIPFYISFANVGWTGGADFNNVGALQVDFNVGGTAAIDVDVGLRNVQVVPEPATLALVGAALLGIGAARRRKASK